MYLLCFILSTLILNGLCDNEDGGKAPRIELNDKNTMPVFGLGTFLGFDQKGQKKVEDREVEQAVSWALNSGYRMLDTAALYLNEDQIGDAVRKSGIPRENIYLVTKLGSNQKRDVVGALRNSLSRLNMSYVDLYLIHFPVSFTPDNSAYEDIDYLDTWKGMEQVQKLGLAKSIGLSNFNISQMERLLSNCEVRPAVLQVEVNLNMAQNKILEFTKQNGIAVMAYSPFGSLFEAKSSAPPPRVDDPTLVGLAKKYGKTVPQVVLRYLVQRGVMPIPKSLHKERIEQNIEIFDFELDSQEMEILSKFNKDFRVVYPSFWQDYPYYPFERKDVPDPDLFVHGKKE